LSFMSGATTNFDLLCGKSWAASITGDLRVRQARNGGDWHISEIRVGSDAFPNRNDPRGVMGDEQELKHATLLHTTDFGFSASVSHASLFTASPHVYADATHHSSRRARDSSPNLANVFRRFYQRRARLAAERLCEFRHVDDDAVDSILRRRVRIG